MDMNDHDINQQLDEKAFELAQKEATIYQQEQFLLSIFNNVQEAIFVVEVTAGGNFRYEGFNPAAHKLTGIETVINKTPADILPPQVARIVEEHYRQCVETKTTVSYEECLPFQGKDTWWLTNLNPIQNESGEIVRIIGTSLNINKRKLMEKELKEEKVFLQALLDNLTDGVAACDRHGNLAMFNKASQNLFVVPQKPLPPEDWAEHYGLYDINGEKHLSKSEIPLYRAFSGESFADAEIMAIPPHEKPRILSCNGSPIYSDSGDKLGAVVTVQDITKRKEAEEEIIKLNAELESKVRQRTVQLEQINSMLLTTTATLEKRNQELDQFAYIVSHDLKAPLRAISNLSLWIEEDLEDRLDDDTRYNMNLLRNRVQRLDNLINGLLTYSRVGRLESKPEMVSVGKILADTIDMLNLNAEFEVKIEGEMPTFVTHLVPLQQVFSNLISNAVKHSECQDTKIMISMVEHQNYYEFAITDNGKGIDTKYHDRIFTIFQTLETKDNHENTGIGLSIVKKAVENQGGTIKVESKVGEGTTFRFTWKK